LDGGIPIGDAEIIAELFEQFHAFADTVGLGFFDWTALGWWHFSLFISERVTV
jgi:hypothetical protein